MKKKDIRFENQSKLFTLLSDKDCEKLSGGKGKEKASTATRSIKALPRLGYGELW